jgi:hypothetical protein
MTTRQVIDAMYASVAFEEQQSERRRAVWSALAAVLLTP